MFYLVPSGLPTNIHTTVLSSYNVSLQWSPPLLEEQNGVIIGYNISIKDSESIFSVYLLSSTTSVIVSILEPYTTYQWRMAAYTSVGLGPYSSWLFFQTHEDG